MSSFKKASLDLILATAGALAIYFVDFNTYLRGW
jgi:hypothetical protein